MSRLPLALLFALILPCAACSEHLVGDEIDTAIVLEGEFGVRVKNAHGRVTIEAIEGDTAQISARIMALDRYRLDTARILLEIEDEGCLDVRIDWPDGGRMARERAHITVRMPRPMFAEVVTRNGQVRVVDVAGDVEVKTSNARIDLNRIGGSIEARTSNAVVVVSDARGEVEVVTSNGAIEATGLAGTVDLKTSNGAVTLATVEDFQGPCRVRTTNGKILMQASAPFGGMVQMKTSSHANCSVRSASYSHVANGRLEHRFDKSDKVCKLQTSNAAVILELP